MWAGVVLLAFAGACGGRSRTTGAADEGAAESPPSAGNFTGNEVTVDTAEPEEGIGPGSGSAFFWAYGLGNWFLYTPPPNATQKDAPIADIVPPRGDSTRAYRAMGSGQPNGADLFAQLNHPQGRALDLNSYYGIGFWAKLSGADENVTVALSDGTQYPQDDLFRVPSVGILLSTDWQPYEVSFAQLQTDGTKIATIDFIVGQSGGAYDLWVNDLALLCRGACPGSAGE